MLTERERKIARTAAEDIVAALREVWPSAIGPARTVDVADGIEGWIEIVSHEGNKSWIHRHPFRVRLES